MIQSNLSGMLNVNLLYSLPMNLHKHQVYV